MKKSTKVPLANIVIVYDLKLYLKQKLKYIILMNIGVYKKTKTTEKKYTLQPKW